MLLVTSMRILASLMLVNMFAHLDKGLTRALKRMIRLHTSAVHAERVVNLAALMFSARHMEDNTHVGELVEWESMKIQEMRDYYLEHYVRNEMKLDVLSRRQGRVVYLVPLVVLPHLSWDFLIQTPVKVEFIVSMPVPVTVASFTIRMGMARSSGGRFRMSMLFVICGR